MSKDTDIAWAAGVWEGEGCWSINPRTRRAGVAVQSRLGMTDPDVVERFGAIVGFGTIRHEPARLNRKAMTQWYTQRRDSTRLLIGMFSPYLGERRRAKAQEILDLGETIANGERTTCPQGHPYDSTAMVSTGAGRHLARRCSICRRNQSRERARKRLNIPPDRWRVPA